MSNATKNDIIILICIIVSHNNVSLLRGGTVFVCKRDGYGFNPSPGGWLDT